MYQIIVVGCGGIGGNYVKELGRFLYQNSLACRCKIVIADGDLVEKSNISRQPFLQEDIGRNKAEVMAEILTNTFCIDCGFFPDFINNHCQLMQMEQKNMCTVLVGAVDNHACRKVMHKYFRETDTIYYFDAANEYSAGEVVVGARISGNEFYPDRAQYFPEILEDTSVPKSEENCEAVNISQPQHILTNLVTANLLLKCTIDILKDDFCEGGIYYFDAFKGYSQFREKNIW
ncbi:ThiF family adenylyltransferase [Mediterraneibacter agrestimuris]|uniref:ThiF family adenylyltransferase n=1 Tax=Mediterraneibacter agrestimuris TaxID=2941333 RepID=UPI00203FFBBB|nr:ThiF family adenylyltransferase [Mediterraneibacter agrestimuris]